MAHLSKLVSLQCVCIACRNKCMITSITCERLYSYKGWKALCFAGVLAPACQGHPHPLRAIPGSESQMEQYYPTTCNGSKEKGRWGKAPCKTQCCALPPAMPLLMKMYYKQNFTFLPLLQAFKVRYIHYLVAIFTIL